MSGPIQDAQRTAPSHWAWVPLKRAADINQRVLGEDTDPDYTFRYIDIAAVRGDGSLGELAELRFADAPSRARRIVQAGDVIVSTVRTYLRAIARVRSLAENLVCSTGFAVLSARPGVDPRFLYWWTRSTPFIEEVVARSVGVGYPAVAPDELGRMPTPIPPGSDQEAISDFLDRECARIDATVAGKRRLLTLLAERLDSVRASWLQDCFHRFGQVPLRRVATQIEQGWSPSADNAPAEPDEWGILKTSAVTAGVFRPEENKRLPQGMNPDPRWIVQDGDLLVTRGSGSLANVGRAAVAATDGRHLIIPDLIYRVRLNGGLPSFVAHVLSSPQLRSLIEACVRTDAGQTLKIRGDDLADLPVPAADTNEQPRLVRSLENWFRPLQETTRGLGRQLDLLAEHRQALISAGVAG